MNKKNVRIKTGSVKELTHSKDEKEVSKLQNKVIYNNYIRGMKVINQRRVKEGLQAVPVRSLKEWLGE